MKRLFLLAGQFVLLRVSSRRSACIPSLPVVGTTTLVRRLKMMYAVTALGGALLLRACGGHIAVYAQSVTPEGMQIRIEDQINRHLEATDARINALSDKISVIQGVGTGVLGVLGVLQILGLVAGRRESHSAPRPANAESD